MFYLKLKGMGAIHAELDYDYSERPFFRKNSCNDEIIIDIPYCRLIITPQRKLDHETGSQCIKGTNAHEWHKQGTAKLSAFDAGASENRP